MKNLFYTTVIVVVLVSTMSNAEVHEREYYYDGGTRVYYDDLEAASGRSDAYNPAAAYDKPIYIIKDHVPLEDAGGNYDAPSDVYRPDLEFVE